MRECAAKAGVCSKNKDVASCRVVLAREAQLERKAARCDRCNSCYTHHLGSERMMMSSTHTHAHARTCIHTHAYARTYTCAQSHSFVSCGLPCAALYRCSSSLVGSGHSWQSKANILLRKEAFSAFSSAPPGCGCDCPV